MMSPGVRCRQAARLNRIQATSTRSVRACIRRVAGCATPAGSAGHAGATANLKLTFHLDHSAGADQSNQDGTLPYAARPPEKRRPVNLSAKPFCQGEPGNRVVADILGAIAVELASAEDRAV
jgi:hypothetical protein